MTPRRFLPIALLSLATVPASAAKVAGPPPPGRNCGDPGGRLITCQALQEVLPPPPWTRCPLCGGRHAAGPSLP
ncbi:hypothetical protein GWK16_09985 [Roseomonas sp. JC162]|uniref:Uncharacterized protein n=1 Tax=Neoroseomonas marina TaxID=1232220 RepID=A0A848EDQ2_9PROT|nr:hypothetical protein [Neoroseomonas marina]NMJ41570.1 hypothetical protein [Neoroseomonas marina]